MTSEQVIKIVTDYNSTFLTFCEEHGISQTTLNEAAERSAKGSSLLWDEDPFLATAQFVYSLVREIDKFWDVIWSCDPNMNHWQFEIINISDYSERDQDDLELRMEQGA
jgi:hypothetical protein